MINNHGGYEMEPLKENVISTLNVVKDNVEKKGKEIQVLTVPLVSKQQKKKSKLQILFETFQLLFPRKEFSFENGLVDSIVLTVGENKLVIREENVENSDLGKVKKNCYVRIKGFDLYCFPVKGEKYSNTSYKYMEFKVMWDCVRRKLKSKRFWKEDFGFKPLW